MQIIAHRGYWNNEIEKNSYRSFKEAFIKGYGIETDIRDHEGQLVISHDIPRSDCVEVSRIFELYREMCCGQVLALNVKADGIQNLLKSLLEQYQIKKYFLFDMSVPEMVVTEKNQLAYFTRQSDIETDCVMYGQSQGVWLDGFNSYEWLTKDVLDAHLSADKKVCIVSPELHQYEYSYIWKLLRDGHYHKSDLVALCTDQPDKARRYFDE